MKPATPRTRAATSTQPNRLLIALAAAWMILSLAIGGAVSADSSADLDASSAITESVQN
ncbi:MAG: hypothetical protein K5924_04995 [Chloroflexi bacterium]|nr:hypothetical protein [Chloroflexota bacterium]